MNAPPTQARIVTTALAAAAFESWENEFRAEPDNFLTEDEVAHMEVAPLSEKRAIYFMALLRKATCPLPETVLHPCQYGPTQVASSA